MPEWIQTGRSVNAGTVSGSGTSCTKKAEQEAPPEKPCTPSRHSKTQGANISDLRRVSLARIICHECSQNAGNGAGNAANESQSRPPRLAAPILQKGDETKMQTKPGAADPENQSGGKWYTLKEAAQILGKSKSTIEYHAGKLDGSNRKADENGIIRISAEAVDAIGQKSRASTQQVPNKHKKALSGAQQAPEKYPTNTGEVPENGLSGTQQAAENRPTSTKQVPESTAEQAAIDALKGIIDGLREELKKETAEKMLHMEQAEQLKQEIARHEEREKAAQDRAERAEKELDAMKAQNQSLTDQLAAIADKQADAIRAGAAEQLALAIPEQTKKRGIFARLFHREKKEN